MITPTVPVVAPAAANRELRQLLAEGLARRYTLRARAEGAEFIVEGVAEPERLPTIQSEVGTGIRPVSRPVPAPEAAAAIRVVVERLQLELEAIEQAGLAACFLLVADCARYGRSIGAACMARGAAPGSLVNYLLEISTVEPIRHGLIFERFWNPTRIFPPAIYLDFADDRLESVIEYVRKKLGSNPVAHLVTDLDSDPGYDLPVLALLGLKALTVLRRTCERVRQTKGIEVPIDHLPLDDAKTYDLLRSDDTSGIFEFESGAMPDLCRKLQPSCFAHISALIAVHYFAPFWPGPTGLIPDFLARRHGRVRIQFEHPSLKPVMRETYGVLIYQEQMMQVAQAVAGYTLVGGDVLRCDMGKKKADEVAQHRIKFVKGAKERNSITASKANRIFDWLEMFSSGFNKAHATAYAMVAYQTAYLKANYPVEFLGAMKAT